MDSFYEGLSIIEVLGIIENTISGGYTMYSSDVLDMVARATELITKNDRQAMFNWLGGWDALWSSSTGLEQTLATICLEWADPDRTLEVNRKDD